MAEVLHPVAPTHPYQSVVALPLQHLGDGWSGALDLYLDEPTKAYILTNGDASVVAAAIARELSTAPAGPTGCTPRPDADADLAAARRRTHRQVWVALGMLALELDNTSRKRWCCCAATTPASP